MLGRVKTDNQELDIVTENESDIEDIEEEECVLSGDKDLHSNIDKVHLTWYYSDFWASLSITLFKLIS